MSLEYTNYAEIPPFAVRNPALDSQRLLRQKMPSNKSLENAYIALLIPAAIVAIGWAIYNFSGELIDWRLGGLAVVTVFFSSFLRIQLPRTKIHVTTSDAAIILAFIWYGGETAIILSFLETAYTTLSYRRQGGTIRYKTILINVIVAVTSVFVTTMVVRGIFGSVSQRRSWVETRRGSS